ncbi:MAG: hypothetical protein M3Q52_04340 [Pseudomonadota bacterium]|nr:hypothetical protein [Pseudomonadota bacterium]
MLLEIVWQPVWRRAIECALNLPVPRRSGKDEPGGAVSPKLEVAMSQDIHSDQHRVGEALAQRVNQ